MPHNNLRIFTGKNYRQMNTPTRTESTNMGIWVVGTSNQVFIRGP